MDTGHPRCSQNAASLSNKGHLRCTRLSEAHEHEQAGHQQAAQQHHRRLQVARVFPVLLQQQSCRCAELLSAPRAQHTTQVQQSLPEIVLSWYTCLAQGVGMTASVSTSWLGFSNPRCMLVNLDPA